MSAYLQKEVRLLRPNFLIGLAAALSIWWVPEHATATDTFWSGLRIGLPFAFCPAMVIMLALDSFGREISPGTFNRLLVWIFPSCSRLDKSEAGAHLAGNGQRTGIAAGHALAGIQPRV